MKRFLQTALGVIFGSSIFMMSAAPVAAAVTKPTVTITSPTIKTRASNEVFTVNGTASGGAGVTNVFYSLNNSAWTNASSANGWSNWMAQVTLIPGTNIVSAFAVDGNSARSATNTVRFIYVVLAPLAVHTSGNGTITPNYNSALLQIGTTYSMTGKSPLKGFGVRNWTDASNNIVTNGVTLKFFMTSNLDFTANFGDVQKPTLRLVSVYTNKDGTANQFFIRGTASDNVGVAGVYFQLNGGSWQSAQFTTNHWTNWVAQLDNLAPGTNTFSAYSTDTSSNSSSIVPLQINNNTAPLKLANLLAYVQPNNAPAFNLAFGTSTFSQNSMASDQADAVGTYTYGPSGAYGLLKAKYVAPPMAATNLNNRNYSLYFVNRTTANYGTSFKIATNLPVLMTNGLVITTNLVATNLTVIEYGTMSFSPAPKLAFSSAVNQLVLAVNQDGDGVGTLFMSGKYTSFPLLTSGTNNGKYTYTVYSPLSGLFKLTATTGTEYVVATFEGTNYGSYYSEDYDMANHPVDANSGRFILGSQKPGGNAPTTLANRAFTIFSGPDSFNDFFGTNTYSQDSNSTNFDNVVGSYTYSLASTNIGLLNLTAVAPPTLTSSNNAARLVFVANNAGLFTNEDNTISSFVMTSVTNSAPTDVSNLRFALRDSSDVFGFFMNYLSFTNDSQFVFNGSVRGNYEYAAFGPASGMFMLNFSTNTDSPGVDWLQINYTSTNSGSYFVNLFDTTNNFLGNAHGTFLNY
jgi:hypothetical protein